MKIGWISLHRKLQDNWLWKEKRVFSKAEAWIDILMEVNHQQEKVLMKNIITLCKIGESVKSQDTWAMRWSWNKSKVRRFLKLLESESMIELKPNRNTTHLKVINYISYQDKRISYESQMNLKRISDESQMTPNNKDNKGNKDNNKITFLLDSRECQLSNCLLNLILLRNPEHKKPNIQSWCKHIDLMIRIDNRNPDDIETIINWCQHDTFWQDNILSTRKLRKQYDQLNLKMRGNENYGINQRSDTSKFNGLSRTLEEVQREIEERKKNDKV